MAKKTKMIAGALTLAALLGASEYVRKPIDYTDTLRGFFSEKVDGNYVLQFESNSVANASLEDSAGTYLKTGSKYHVVGYQNLWGKYAKTVERIN